MNLNIFIAGVGGQGNLFASGVLADYSINKGYKVLGVETIGAAQRGGSVVSHLRISDSDLYAPLIPKGMADVIMGFETLEMLRNLDMLSTEGIYILNDYKEPTVLCNMALDTYPTDQEITRALQESGKKGYTIRATEYARQLGDSLYTNVVMLGALSQVLPFFNGEQVGQVVAAKSSARLREQNLKAFRGGASLIREANRRS